MSDKLEQMKQAFAKAKKRYNDFNGIINVPEDNYATKITEISFIEKHAHLAKIIRTITEGQYTGDKLETLIDFTREVSMSFYMQWLKNYGIEGVSDIEDPTILINMTQELAENIENGLEIKEEVSVSFYTSPKNGKKYLNVNTLSFINDEEAPVVEKKEEPKKKAVAKKKKTIAKKKTESVDLVKIIKALSAIEGLELSEDMDEKSLVEALEPFTPLNATDLSDILSPEDVDVLRKIGVDFE